MVIILYVYTCIFFWCRLCKLRSQNHDGLDQRGMKSLIFLQIHNFNSLITIHQLQLGFRMVPFRCYTKREARPDWSPVVV